MQLATEGQAHPSEQWWRAVGCAVGPIERRGVPQHLRNGLSGFIGGESTFVPVLHCDLANLSMWWVSLPLLATASQCLLATGFLGVSATSPAHPRVRFVRPGSF